MHTCPECGQACTCRGDIDDVMWPDDSPEAIGCIHIDLEGCDRELDDDYCVEEEAQAAEDPEVDFGLGAEGE